mmetsp:Transcript_26151/g.40932  ORF Transcript_26151/g.40932 Transcript_26151/m.40932 type:complete len:165 (-) Transcript_26151:21-515(-)
MQPIMKAAQGFTTQQLAVIPTRAPRMPLRASPMSKLFSNIRPIMVAIRQPEAAEIVVVTATLPATFEAPPDNASVDPQLNPYLCQELSFVRETFMSGNCHIQPRKLRGMVKERMLGCIFVLCRFDIEGVLFDCNPYLCMADTKACRSHDEGLQMPGCSVVHGNN